MASKTQQKVIDVLSCTICLNRFVDPRMLACSHVFCLACIQKLADSNHGQFICPMGDETVIERDDIDSLPKNRIASELIDMLLNMVPATKNHTVAPQCYECSSLPATLWCAECNVGYCESCEKHNKKMKLSCSNCETVTCTNCHVSRNHNDHTILPIDEVIPNVIEELNEKFKKAQELLNQAIEKELSSVCENESIIDSITEVFNDIHKTIDRHEKSLKEKIHIIDEKNTKLSENYFDLLMKKQTELSKHNKDFAQTVSSGEHAQILDEKKRLLVQLNQLMNELINLKVPIKSKYWIEGLDSFQAKVDEILKKVCFIEQKPENEQFDAPDTQPALSCEGRSCIDCHQCRDWYFEGDAATWKWIGDCFSWTEEDLHRYYNRCIYTGFKKRDGATCTTDLDDVGDGYLFHCTCPSNRKI